MGKRFKVFFPEVGNVRCASEGKASLEDEELCLCVHRIPSGFVLYLEVSGKSYVGVL